MKALILSVRPEHAYNILTGKKTLELRKNVPKGYKGWVYVYVTKAIRDYKQSYYYQPKGKEEIFRLHGIIPFRFWFDEYEEVPRTDYTRKQSDTGLIPMMKSNGETYYERIVVNLREGYEYDDCEESCLTNEEIKSYGKGKDLYAWHIKQLEIFERPMQLSNFITTIIPMSMLLKGEYVDYKTVKKAPQSYMYAWVKEEGK